MAIIGTFTLKDGKFNGKISTLAVNVSVGILPNSNAGGNEPAYRVFLGKFEAGAAWEKTSETTAREYLSVKLDDPTFPAPIYANLIEQENGTYALLWSRPQAR